MIDFWQVLLKKLGMKNIFYLLGYESGIYIALEVAAILEDLGKYYNFTL